MVNCKDKNGLANNLKTIITAIDNHGVYYPQWKRVPYTALFTNKTLKKAQKKDLYTSDFLLRSQHKLPQNFTYYPYSNNYKKLNGKLIDQMYSLVPKEIRNQITAILKILTVNPYLAEVCNKFYQRHNYKISLHLRTFKTDDWDFHEYNNSYNELIRILTNLPSQKIFIASDNFEAAVSLKRTVTTHEFVMFKLNLPWYQLALCDMILLSYGNLLFTPQFSTFSELSWYMGNCQQDVCNYKSARYLMPFQTIWHKGDNHELNAKELFAPTLN